VHLFSQSRGKLKWNDPCGVRAGAIGRERALGRRVPRRLRPRGALADGAAAGAAERPNLAASSRRFVWRRRNSAATTLSRRTARGGAPRQRQVLRDWQHDVTTKIWRSPPARASSRSSTSNSTHDRHGHRSGQDSNLNAMAIVAQKLDVPIPRVGHTTSACLHAGDLRQLRPHLAR